jgi:hypothetical protein
MAGFILSGCPLSCKYVCPFTAARLTPCLSLLTRIPSKYAARNLIYAPLPREISNHMNANIRASTIVEANIELIGARSLCDSLGKRSRTFLGLTLMLINHCDTDRPLYSFLSSVKATNVDGLFLLQICFASNLFQFLRARGSEAETYPRGSRFQVGRLYFGSAGSNSEFTASRCYWLRCSPGFPLFPSSG